MVSPFAVLGDRIPNTREEFFSQSSKIVEYFTTCHHPSLKTQHRILIIILIVVVVVVVVLFTWNCDYSKSHVQKKSVVDF
jgi:hypothetical protein